MFWEVVLQFINNWIQITAIYNRLIFETRFDNSVSSENSEGINMPWRPQITMFSETMSEKEITIDLSSKFKLKAPRTVKVL